MGIKTSATVLKNLFKSYRRSEPTKVGLIILSDRGTPALSDPNNFSACLTSASWSTPPAAARTYQNIKYSTLIQLTILSGV
jgi:hypothetical protein